MKKFLLKLCLPLGLTLSAYAGSSLFPTTQVDSMGNLYNVWLLSVNSDSNYVIQFSTASWPGSSWSTETISGNNVNLDYSASPLFAINSGGDAIVVWIAVNPNTFYYDVYANIRPSGGSWTGSQPVGNSANGAGDALSTMSVAIGEGPSAKITVIFNAYTDGNFSGIGTYTATTTVSTTPTWSSVTQLSS